VLGLARTLADGTEFFRFALPDARLRRTRIALARSQPTKAGAE